MNNFTLSTHWHLAFSVLLVALLCTTTWGAYGAVHPSSTVNTSSIVNCEDLKSVHLSISERWCLEDSTCSFPGRTMSIRLNLPMDNAIMLTEAIEELGEDASGYIGHDIDVFCETFENHLRTRSYWKELGGLHLNFDTFPREFLVALIENPPIRPIPVQRNFDFNITGTVSRFILTPTYSDLYTVVHDRVRDNLSCRSGYQLPDKIPSVPEPPHFCHEIAKTFRMTLHEYVCSPTLVRGVNYLGCAHVSDPETTILSPNQKHVVDGYPEVDFELGCAGLNWFSESSMGEFSRGRQSIQSMFENQNGVFFAATLKDHPTAIDKSPETNQTQTHFSTFVVQVDSATILEYWTESILNGIECEKIPSSGETLMVSSWRLLLLLVVVVVFAFLL